MRYALAPLALAALVAATPMPAAPAGSPPAGCSSSYSGSFEIEVVNVTSSGKRDILKRDTTLTIKLSDGKLTDSQGRTGYIASNDQFQFNTPVQANAIYTSGFSVCGNKSLAIGGSAVWYSCLSGTFDNLYSKSQGGQCYPVYIEAVSAGGMPEPTAAPASAASTPATSSVAAESTDGQVTATPVSSSAACTEYKDGQPQCPSAVPTSSAECSEYKDGQPQCSSAVATSSAECSEYKDGQPQCSSAAPTPTAECSEYKDGQPQCSSAAPMPTAECSEYKDGQPQCSSAAPMPTAECSEYVDGQPQCSTAAVQPSYYSATAGMAPSASYTGPAIATGAGSAVNVNGGVFHLAAGLAAGVLAFAIML